MEQHPNVWSLSHTLTRLAVVGLRCWGVVRCGRGGRGGCWVVCRLLVGGGGGLLIVALLRLLIHGLLGCWLLVHHRLLVHWLLHCRLLVHRLLIGSVLGLLRGIVGGASSRVLVGGVGVLGAVTWGTVRSTRGSILVSLLSVIEVLQARLCTL